MNILLPIETINRELDFKLILAGLLRESENAIFIGQHDFLMQLLPNFKNGIYIGKNIFHKRADIEKGEIYKTLKRQGFDIIYLHEEGAVFRGREDNWKKVLSSQYDLKFFDENDVICVWGDFQKRHDESRSTDLKIEVTGHPRFDLYKERWLSFFQKEEDALRDKYGKYILVNGNYSTYNHGLGLDYVFSEKAGYKPDDFKKRMERIDFIKYTGSQCLSMIQLTHELSILYPEMKIIYRPHPSENQNFYETVFRGVNNIKVEHDGSVTSWILGAEAIIHDGCTTAIEASIAGKPVINYKPIENETTDIWLPNQLGDRCNTIDEVKSVLNKIGENNFNIEYVETKDEIKDLMYNFGNDSFQKLLDVIKAKIEDSEKKETRSPSDTYIQNQYIKQKVKAEFSRIKNAKSRKAYEYHLRKFYGFDKTYIKEKIKVLEDMLSKKIEYKYHNPYLIEIR